MKTYTGHGISAMLDTCARYGLTKDNSKLYIKSPDDLGSFWRITTTA